ncbi:hypothetical protein F4553_004363 [Allocatelliglobosispora scoriae]|uniref:Uncharacterized protein n=1 Tax=Allocatelliglobosispora scoriae TaxID=643052 RepID=A0A841BRW7_9ACTN|nr:hypothetical protein [Allocatelliglobosispora scoriae]MBB5870984.1 hypothetical protein [Allocatelliglobosispora scoriae]
MQWSSRRPWRRYAAEVSTALLISLPLLAGSASANPEASPQVDFGGGGLGMLLCGSKPSVGTISVPAQAKVIFVNNLGQRASLQIDGEDGGPVGNGEAVEVQFHRGPVSVAMVPECLLNLTGDFKPVTVQVTPPKTPPRTPPRTTSPRPTAGPASPASGGGNTTSPKPNQSRPGTTPAATAEPGVVDPTDPDLTGDDELFPIPPDGGSPTPGADAATTTTTVVKNTDGSIALPRSSNRDRGPIGLLAIIATVCVVGVAAGAIRAIITQRASRTEFA